MGTYRGTGPFSEPTMEVWRNYFSNVKNWTPMAYINVHSYSQFILCNFAADRTAIPEDPDNYDDQYEVSKWIATNMTQQFGVPYTYGQARDIMYAFGGSAQDFFHSELGVPLSF